MMVVQFLCRMKIALPLLCMWASRCAAGDVANSYNKACVALTFFCLVKDGSSVQVASKQVIRYTLYHVQRA
jgi:hypothetical protein